ncbi:MAG: hypothetical protein IPJ01_11885 [Micavibrio sp.]|nr:hypothetical protein [Micavibrio sp.]
MNKSSRNILILGGFIMSTIGAYFAYNKYKEIRVVRELEKKVEEEKKMKEQMREKYKDIKTVDDFIQGSKYLENNAPFGYNLDSLESKKYFLSKVNFTYLKEVYGLLNKGLANNTEAENTKLIEFLPKIFLN